MRYIWLCSLGSLTLFVLLDLGISLPDKEFRKTNVSEYELPISGLERQKRQIKGTQYDPTLTAAILVAIGLMMCSPPSAERKRCNINIKNLENSHALIINPQDHTKFIYPDETGNINFEERQPVFLSCPGQDNYLKNVPDKREFYTFNCVCNEAFDADNTVYNFKDLVCESPPQYDIVSLGTYGREQEFRMFDIGFHTDAVPSFLKLIHIRYDRSSISTMWVKSDISKSIAGSQKTAKNRRFDKTLCCENTNHDPEEAYNKIIQDHSFATQMKCHTSEYNKCSYFSESKDLVFNRGHLTPKSTMVYTSAGIATFVYLNTEPQWKPINDGNWARIEEHVIEMAKGLKKDLTVYTGVAGRLMLKDTADNDNIKYIFLFKNDYVNMVPIPLYFWKIVYDPESKKGITYVTVNNPHMENYEAHQICNNAMTTRDGIKLPKQWKPKYIPKGFSYMCSVSDFVQYNGISLDFYAHTVTELLYLPNSKSKPSTSIKHNELKRRR